MAKDETPLPSPEKTCDNAPLARCESRRKNIRPSGSQTLTTTTSGRLHKGSDGRMYLADETPLNEVIQRNGDVYYLDPHGVMYTSDGIPIAPDPITYKAGDARPRECGPCYSPTDPEQMDETPIVSDSRIHRPLDIQPRECTGPCYLPTDQQQMDETRIASDPRIHRVEDVRSCMNPCSQPTNPQATYLADGTPVTEIVTPNGVRMYQGPRGELYNLDGTPVHRYPEKRKAKCCGGKKQNVHEKSRSLSPVPQRSPSVSPVCSRTVAVSTRMVPKPRQQKPGSAPTSSDAKISTQRPCKSAESAT